MQNYFANAKARLKTTFRRPNSVIPEAQVAPMAQVQIADDSATSGATYTRRIVPVSASAVPVATVDLPVLNQRIAKLMRQLNKINKEISNQMAIGSLLSHAIGGGGVHQEEVMTRLYNERRLIERELYSLGVVSANTRPN